MRMLRRSLARIAGLFHRRRSDAELDAEIDAHLEAHTAENLAAGMGPKEARRQAVLKLGGVDAAKEAYRDQRGIPWLETTWADLNYGWRMLWKCPGFTLIVILMLALGIGGSSAVYSVVNAVILNPLPGPEPERLFQIGEQGHGNKDEFRFSGLTTETVEILQKKSEFFSSVVWHASYHFERRTPDFIEGIGGSFVSTNFFDAWQIQPLLGRTFTGAEAVRVDRSAKPLDDGPIVLSYALWKSRFAGDPSVIGTKIDGNDRQFTIIGVMPRHFQYPHGSYPALWVPAQTPPPQEELANNRLFVRLRPGVTIEQVRAMLGAVAAQLVKDRPDIYDSAYRRRGLGFALLARPLRDEFTRTHYGVQELQRTLWGLQAAIGFVLMIVCLNVGNLMLARTEKRQQELAIRAAIGARRGRLIRQLLTESVLLAILGGTAGLFITFFGAKSLVALIPVGLPRLREVQIDGMALGVTLILCLGTALAFGLAPAWHAARESLGNALKQAGTGATMSASWRRYRGALVAAEVALSLALLVGAGLMIRSVARLLEVNPGYDAENLLMARPGLLRTNKYYQGNIDAIAASHAALNLEFHRRMAELPGVDAVGISRTDFFTLGFSLEGEEGTFGCMPAGTGVGESDFFRALRTPLLAGRYFESTDIGKNVGTVIVNETMARMCWAGRNPLSKKFRDKSGRVFEVVGVVADVRTWSYDEKVEPMFFRPFHESAHRGGMGPLLWVRTRGDVTQLIPAIRNVIKEVEPTMTAPGIELIRQRLYESTEGARMYRTCLLIFAGLGLTLAALGIYGVLAYSVARRTRELGIRKALGAQRHHLMTLIAGEAARLVGIGILTGILASIWLTKFMANQLFNVSPTDPIVFAAVVVTLAAVALLACLIPAWRASRIAACVALRCE